MTIENLFSDATQNRKPEQLYQPIEYILMQSGKKIRPRLVMLGAELFEGDAEQAVYVAAAFEMLHNFTLIHDDIMDKAPIRRGKETVYKKWNSNIAILSGDALANLALQQILKADISHETRFEIINLFIQTSLEVCEGQQYDLNFETSEKVFIDDYLMMIRLKTAVMLAGCLKAGSILAGASSQEQEILYQFGIKIGIAFQLKDDLLDIYADHAIFGKKRGMDIQDNKKTYLILRAIEDASKEDKEELTRLFSSTEGNFEQKLLRVTSLYEKYAIKEKTEAVIEEYFQQALSQIKKLSVNDNKKEKLKEIALQLCERIK